MSKYAPKLSELKKEFDEKPSVLKGDYSAQEWWDIPVEFRDGNWCFPGKPEVLADLGFANPRKWAAATGAHRYASLEAQSPLHYRWMNAQDR